MKVWVVVEGTDCEGYGPPEAVFLSEERANAFKEAKNNERRPHSGTWWDVYDVEVTE